MDEYEKLESELKQVYEEYVIKYRYPPSNWGVILSEVNSKLCLMV